MKLENIARNCKDDIVWGWCTAGEDDYDYWINVATNVQNKPAICNSQPPAPAYQVTRMHLIG
jgi:hypothetical protein